MANLSETVPGAYVLGIDKAENTGPLYEALRAAGYAWRGQALSLHEALRQLEIVQDKVNLVLVRAELARRGEEAALLESLARWPLVVLLGVARADRQAEIVRLPNVRAVIVVPPYDFSGLSDLPLEKPMLAPSTVPSAILLPATARVADGGHTALPQGGLRTAQPPRGTPPEDGDFVHARSPRSDSGEGVGAVGQTRTTPVASSGSVSRTIVARARLAFYGTRGGIGTSTAALQAAKLLAGHTLSHAPLERGRCAGRGVHVALFDVRQRGDLHLMLGYEPTAQPLHHDLITVYLAEPTEEIAAQHEAIVIDGGRQRGAFNAQWIEVYRPLEENALRRLVGLPLVDQSNGDHPPRRLNLSKIFSIEVTE